MINFEQEWRVSERMRERREEAEHERLALASRAASAVERPARVTIGVAVSRVRDAIARRLIALAGAS